MPTTQVTIQGVMHWDDSGQGGHPSQPIFYPGHPSHPIAPPPGHIATLPVFPFDPTDPGYGVGRPVRPDQGLPGSGGHPDQGLPGSGARPDNSLPHPGIVPGAKFVVKWLACQGLILVPDNELPSAPAHPEQGLPPTAQPKK